MVDEGEFLFKFPAYVYLKTSIAFPDELTYSYPPTIMVNVNGEVVDAVAVFTDKHGAEQFGEDHMKEFGLISIFEAKDSKQCIEFFSNYLSACPDVKWIAVDPWKMNKNITTIEMEKLIKQWS